MPSLTSLPTDVSSPEQLLSFCIPTYNRCASLLPLVRQILLLPGKEIQVVVLDNGSTDDTLTSLASIDDDRLLVRSNGHNRGVLFNVVNVLLQGTGKYSVLLLDKDRLDITLVDDFLRFLRNEQPECGYCEYGLSHDAPPRLFSRGEPALRGVAYSCHHPTGFFFRTQSLRAIKATDRFTDYELVGHFPFEFMHAELCLRGPAAIYQAPVFSPEILEVAKSEKSHGTHAGKEDAFFSPNGRLKMAVNFSDHISSLDIGSDVKRELILAVFAQGLLQSTLGFRRIMANESVCEHYHIAPRRIGILETLGTGWWFYSQFSERFLRREPDGVQISHGYLLIVMLRHFQRALARRFFHIFDRFL